MKISAYIASGILLWAGSACSESWLDLEPSTAVRTEEVISVLSDVNFQLNGVYNAMQDAYSYSGRLVYYGDATGDDMQAYSSSKRTGSYYLLSFTKSNSPATFWENPYGMIQMCNIILESIDGLDTSDTALRDCYKGQALGLRAMFLFDLTRFYGYPYKKDNGASLGVPVVTTVLNKDDKPARNTVAECYGAVVDDLKQAVSLLDNKEGRAFAKGRLNRWGAMTLLSRVYLYRGDDKEALRVAEEAIAGAEAEGYRLWTNAEYPTAWGNDASKSAPGEVLFELVNTTDDSPGKESLGRLHNPNGYKDICVTTSFYELLAQDAKDVRLKLMLYSSSRGFLYKYQPQEGEDIADANIPLLRLSETYLNAAEAAVKTNDNTKAVKYLDAIVRRANPANTVEGTLVTTERVMTERRKELAGEGHRMFDALRDGGYVDRHEAAKVDSKVKSTKHLTMSDSQKMHFNWDYYKCVLAIPKAEMDANRNMKQNPGYDSAAE